MKLRPLFPRNHRTASAPRPERNRRKIDVLAVLRGALLLALAGQCLRVAFASPRLRIREVRVTGTRRYAPKDIVRLAEVPMGQNLFRVNLGRVARRLQEEPALEQVMVTRQFPGTLRVEVQERMPALRVVAGTIAFHSDKEGVVFEAAPAPNSLPVLELPEDREPPLGGSLQRDLVRAVWDCVRLSRRDRLALQKMRVDASGDLWLNIQTNPGSPSPGDDLAVRIGRWTELPEKFRDVRNCLAGWPGLSASAVYLNVVSAGNPARLDLGKQAPKRARRNHEDDPHEAPPDKLAVAINAAASRLLAAQDALPAPAPTGAPTPPDVGASGGAPSGNP